MQISLFEVGNKVKKTKRQRQQEKYKHIDKARSPKPALPVTPVIEPQWQIPENFRVSQENDPSIKPLFAKVCEIDRVPTAGTVGMKSVIRDPYILKDNLLYLADIEKPRPVIPKEYCQVTLHLGHTIPWAGHLGRAKT